MPDFRTDILRVSRDDGGLDLVDLIMDRLHRFDASEAAAIASGDAAMWARLETLFVVDNAMGRMLQEQQWAGRARGVPVANQALQVADVDWSRAAAFPEEVSAFWRDGERWRRLAEERAAGRAMLVVRGFLTPEAVQTLRAAVEVLDYKRWELELVHAEHHVLQDDELTTWRGLFHNDDVRHVLGGVLGVSLEARTTINAWRVSPGDYFRAHVDGKNYVGTFSLGLCDGWTAADGGAIAFGTPQPEGFEVQERWLPHGGDLCLFRPREAWWHTVEPVESRTRLTLTGWWMI